MVLKSLIRCCAFLSVILMLVVGGAHSSFAVKKFSMGVEDYIDFLPYSDFKNGEFTGLGKDILDLFAEKHGYVFEYKPLPLKRRDMLFLQNKLDFIFPDNPYWVADQKKGIKITYAPMLEFTDGVVVIRQNKGKGIEALKKMGMPTGFTPWQYLGKVESGEIKVEESRYNGLYWKLIKGRIDGVYVNIKIANHYWNKIPEFKKNPVVFDPDLPHATGFWYLSSIKYPKIVKEFEVFMKENSRTIEQMKDRYDF